MQDKANQNAALVIENGQYFLTGHLNYSNVTQLFENSIKSFQQTQPFIVNFSRLESGNTAVIVLMIEWMKFAKNKHLQVEFESLPEKVKSIANAAGLQELIGTK